MKIYKMLKEGTTHQAVICANTVDSLTATLPFLLRSNAENVVETIKEGRCFVFDLEEYVANRALTRRYVVTPD